MVYRYAALGLVVVIGLAIWVTACAKKESQSQTGSVANTAGTTTTLTTQVVTTASGLQYQVLKDGTGAVAKAGQMVSVHYTGWLTDGKKFDSSVDRGQPFQFSLGAGQVIKGWDEGVAGMKVGEKRKLTIPSNLGYGAGGAGGVIPGNATLVFDVELLGIQ
ncbi:MAG TPA: FKBP-type peptidyl-prolyl cis-trans isomerase [bacterium]